MRIDFIKRLKLFANQIYIQIYPNMSETTEQQTLVIRIDWWLGRVIAMTWAVTKKAQQQPVKVVTSRPLAFWWNPHIQSIHGLDDRDLFRQVIKWNDYFELEPYTDPEFFNDWKNWLDIAAKQLWLDKVAEPCLYLAEHEKMNNYLEWVNPILYQPFGSTMWWNGWDKSYRSIKVPDAQYIANKLVEMWYTPYLVIKPWQPVLQNCKVLDTPDLRFVVSLCDRYPLLWADSCLHHAVKAFKKKAVVVRAWTDVERYWYKSNINMRENPFVAFTPMRLPMNSFDYDISNQKTNIFSKKFLDEVVSEFSKIAPR